MHHQRKYWLCLWICPPWKNPAGAHALIAIVFGTQHHECTGKLLVERLSTSPNQCYFTLQNEKVAIHILAYYIHHNARICPFQIRELKNILGRVCPPYLVPNPEDETTPECTSLSQQKSWLHAPTVDKLITEILLLWSVRFMRLLAVYNVRSDPDVHWLGAVSPRTATKGDGCGWRIAVDCYLRHRDGLWTSAGELSRTDISLLTKPSSLVISATYTASSQNWRCTNVVVVVVERTD